MNAIHSFFPQLLIAFHRVESADDMDNYLSRVSQSARAVNQLVGLSKQVAATGVRPPYCAFEETIQSARDIITGAPVTEDGEDSAIWADAQSKIATLLITIFALGVALWASDSVFGLVLGAWSALGASLGPLVILRVFRRPVAPGVALAMMATGIAVVTAWDASPWAGAVFKLGPGMVSAFCVWLVGRALSSE